MKLREYARRRGVVPSGVMKAVKNGRLAASVAYDENGVPYIADVELADAEWVGNSSRAERREARTGPNLGESTLSEEQRGVARERARKLKLENDLRAGQLVEADQAAREAFEFARAVRDNVLNVPSRLAGELAAESDQGKVYSRLDAALRQALEATAAVLEGGAGGQR